MHPNAWACGQGVGLATDPKLVNLCSESRFVFCVNTKGQELQGLGLFVFNHTHPTVRMALRVKLNAVALTTNIHTKGGVELHRHVDIRHREDHAIDGMSRQ
jgi:hypothetical protein